MTLSAAIIAAMPSPSIRAARRTTSRTSLVAGVECVDERLLVVDGGHAPVCGADHRGHACDGLEAADAPAATALARSSACDTAPKIEWPISPAPEPSPWYSWPPRMMPAPMPSPTRTTIRFCGHGDAAVCAFRHGGGLRVVGHDDRHSEALGDHAAEGHVRPVEVDGPAHDAGARVDEARRPDADAEHGARAVALDQAVDQAVDDLDGVGAVAAVELDLGRFDDAAAHVDERAAELRRAKVQADGVAAVRRGRAA